MSAIEHDAIESTVLIPWRDLRGAPHPKACARARSRTHLVRMGDGWPDTGWIGLPVSEAARHGAIEAGAEEGPSLDGNTRVCVPRVHAVKDAMQPYVPFIARRNLAPIPFPALPADAIDLQDVLSEGGWSRLQRKAVRETGGVCEICGDGGAPRAVPIWHHLLPHDPSLEGVRRLERLLVVCPDCAGMFPQGGDGRLAAPVERLIAVNAWTTEELEEHEAWKAKATALLTGYDWVFDLTAVADDDDPVEISRDWQVDESVWRLRKGGDGPTTHVLGVPFSIAGSVYAAQSPEPFVDI